MGVGGGGGGDLPTDGVGGGGGSDLSLQPNLISLAGVAMGQFSTEPGLGVVCWEEPWMGGGSGFLPVKNTGMLRCWGGIILVLGWELLAGALLLHRSLNFCCRRCIFPLFLILDGCVGVFTAFFCVGFFLSLAPGALASLDSTKVALLSALSQVYRLCEEAVAVNLV